MVQSGDTAYHYDTWGKLIAESSPAGVVRRELIYLGDVTFWGSNTWSINRVGMPAAVAVAPGQNVSFSFNVTAPTAPGTYNFQWKMLRDEIGNWFGDVTPNVAVTVQAANTLYFIHPDHRIGGAYIRPPWVQSLLMPRSKPSGFRFASKDSA